MIEKGVGCGRTHVGSSDHIQELDGLRALAVILVFVGHFWIEWTHVPIMGALARCGWTGVDLFLVLSGFLITRGLLRTRRSKHYYRDFYLARAFRIFPAYYLLLVSVLFMVILQGYLSGRAPKSGALGDLAWFAVYLGNLKVAATASVPSVIPLFPLWSLQVEEQFYCVFPFVVKSCGRKALLIILVSAVLLSLLVRVLLSWRFPENPSLEYVLLPCRMDGLAYGAGLALWFGHFRYSSRNLLTARIFTTFVAVLFGLTMIFLRTQGYDWRAPLIRTVGYSLSALTYALIVFWAIQFRNTPSTAWLTAKPLRFIGRISYGIYLWQAASYFILLHSPLRTRFPDLHWSETSDWIPKDVVGFAAISGLTISLALISWFGVEQPALRLKARFLSRTQQPAGTVSNPAEDTILNRMPA